MGLMRRHPPPLAAISVVLAVVGLLTTGPGSYVALAVAAAVMASVVTAGGRERAA